MEKWLYIHAIAFWTYLAISPVLIFSQQSSSYPDLDKVIDQLTQVYSLTSDQVGQVRAVYVECQNKSKPYRENLKPENRSMIGQMRKERDDKVYKLLKPEQQSIFNDRKTRKEEMRSMSEKRKTQKLKSGN